MEVLFSILFVVVFLVVFSVIVVSVVKTVKKSGGQIKSLFNENDELIKMVKKNFDKQQNPQKYRRHCEYCGTELSDDATKCDSCGAKITKKDD